MIDRASIALLVLIACGSTVARAQDQQAQAGALRVFLDCGGCDAAFFRQTIEWINWVRDPAASEVHVLVTNRSNAGTLERTLEFLGRERFAGQNQTLTISSSLTDTADEQRETLARVVRIGLARYAVQTQAGTQLDVMPILRSRAGVARPQDDPWNFWVMSLGADGSFNGEERTSVRTGTLSASANRTTDAWKIDLRTNVRESTSTYEFDDGTSFRNATSSLEGGGQVVKSYGDHWGVGAGAFVQRSTFLNLLPSPRVAGAVEYNVFPYAESSRRSLTFTYFNGPTHFRYEEETIYLLQAETLVSHGAMATLALSRPWGSTTVELSARQFLPEAAQHRVTVNGDLDVRVRRGLSVRLAGDYSRIRDQRSLPRRGASDEEVLVRRRALATGASVSISVGVTYSFGSIFNSTINSRLSGQGGRFARIY